MRGLEKGLADWFREWAVFLKWVVYACVAGLAVGLAAAAFHYGIDMATAIRRLHPWVVWFLPLGGIAIIWLYRVCGMEQDRGTNRVLVAVRDGVPMRLRTAPLIFISTIITHLVGGSAGREGAALQLGGSMAAYIGGKFRLDEKDRRVMVMCGMAAAFSALFGTPITAAVFAMEVVSVGVMYYAAIVPCFISSMSAFLLAQALGLHGVVGYSVGASIALSPVTMLQTAVLGLLCAIVSILFCEAMHLSRRLYERYVPDPIWQAAVGGVLVLALTLICGHQLYNGAGDGLIRQLLWNKTPPAAFLMKILFTALTLGAGFRGGEIVPALCTGCAFGAWAGPLLGMPQTFAGALGMTAVFCGVTNCPITSILLAYELFGGRGIVLFALCSAVSYMLSGYYGLYSEQKIVYSKFRPEWINKKAD